MIRPAAGALAVLLLAGCAVTSTAGASCVGPQVTVTPTTFGAGDRVRVEGEYFFDDCYDGGQPGNPPATRDIEFRLVPSEAGARTFVLTAVDADDDGEVDTTVDIPDDVPAGPARIEGGFGRPADVVVTAP
jgi:hypothetical protein